MSTTPPLTSMSTQADAKPGASWSAASEDKSLIQKPSENAIENAYSRSGGEAAAMLAESPPTIMRGMLDCPVHKYFTMVIQPSSQSTAKPPCAGCRQKNMSQVRHHLKSSAKHREFFWILLHCERCEKDVIERYRDDGIDDQAWTDGGHKTGTCIKQFARRASVIGRWVRLYLAIFPLEHSVPNPCK